MYILLTREKCDPWLWYVLYLSAIRLFLGRNFCQFGQISLIPTYAPKPHSLFGNDVYIPLKLSSQGVSLAKLCYSWKHALYLFSVPLRLQ